MKKNSAWGTFGLVVAAVAMLSSFVSCSDVGFRGEPAGEKITVPNGKLTWTDFDITEYTKLAKPGAKLHISVSNEGEYCKFQVLTKEWGDSGVTEIFKEGLTSNIVKFQTIDDENNPCHRPTVESEGDFEIVLNEAALSKSSLALMGNAKVNYLTIEYVGGKKADDSSDAPDGYTTKTVLSSETKAPDSWGEILTINHGDFTDKVAGMRITYKGRTGETAMKITVSNPWTENTVKSITGNATLADDNAINSFTADGTLLVFFNEGMAAKFVGEGHDGAWGGLTIQGNGITITKIELLIPSAK